MSQVQVERSIAADPRAVYDLVSDVTSMGRWSPETRSCRWIGGATGPVVGARFRGANRQGWRRWSTTCTVVSADPGRQFAFDVHAGPIPVARWTYDFAEDSAGCRVTETWVDHRPALMVRLTPLVTGVGDRQEHNRDGMETTLEQLARAAESSPAL